MRKLLLFIFFSACFSVRARAQSADTGGVTLHADARLALVTSAKAGSGTGTGSGTRGGSIHSAKGFRVQIYSGTDRSKATQIKIDFMRRFPGVRSYLSYIAPAYRVKVGDFRTRDEASRFYALASNYFNPCIVVPDIVEINTFHNND